MRKLIVSLGLATGLLVGPAGCQTYEPQPLNLPGHVETWRSRPALLSPEAAAMLEDRLDAMGVGAVEAGADGEPSADAAALSLTLADARLMALWLNPQLRVARAEAGVPTAGVEFAELWPDPELGFNLKRITESVDHPWLGGVSLGFTIPLSGRLEAQRDLAMAQSAEAVQKAAGLEAQLLRDLTLDWLHLASMRQQLADVKHYARELDALAADADRLAQAGEITPTDARVFAIQRTQTQARLAQLRAHNEGHRLALLERIGLHPEVPVQLATAESATTSAGAADEAMPIDSRDEVAALLEHPEARIAVVAYEAAEQTLRLEMARQYPDLNIGPTYDNEQGQSRIGLGLGIPVPAWNRNQRGIAEAAAARDAARVRAQAAVEWLVHQKAQTQQAYDAATSRLDRIGSQLQPLVQQQLDEVRQLIRQGELNVLLVDSVLEKWIDLQRDREAARLAVEQAAVRLRYLMDPASLMPAREESQ